jgi:hypothetical protein
MQLNSFSADERRDALVELHQMAEQGLIVTTPFSEIANMHCHTYISYYGYGM